MTVIASMIAVIDKTTPRVEAIQSTDRHTNLTWVTVVAFPHPTQVPHAGILYQERPIGVP